MRWKIAHASNETSLILVCPFSFSTAQRQIPGDDY